MPNAGPAPSDTRLSSGPLAIGALVLDGRFRVTSLLGGGGMGMVYRGHDPAHARPVAIKLLAAAGERARFAREARLLGTIDHPAVVRYLDHGVTEAGVDYLVSNLRQAKSIDALEEALDETARALLDA